MARSSLPWLVALAAAVAVLPPDRGAAHAEDAIDAALRCRSFKHGLEDGQLVDTSDQTSEVGQWVVQERAQGWRLHHLDFEVSQKPSGFAQGYVHVCLER